MTLLARDILDKNLRNNAVIKEIDTKGLGLHLATAPSKTNLGNSAEQDNTFEGDCSSDDDQPIKAPPKKPAQAAKKGLSNRKLKLLDLAISNPAQVKIFRKNYHRKSGGSLFKKYNGILKSYTDSTANFTNGAIIRLSDLSFNDSHFNSLAAGNDGSKNKQTQNKV